MHYPDAIEDSFYRTFHCPEKERGERKSFWHCSEGEIGCPKSLSLIKVNQVTQEEEEEEAKQGLCAPSFFSKISLFSTHN